MKQKDTVEGVSRKLNVFELNGKTFFKGLGAKLSITIAGVLAIGAVSITALADYRGIEVSDANTEASTTTTRNNQSEVTTASATMSWWKAGVSEYDLTQTEEITESVTTVKKTSSDKATTVKESATQKETATVKEIAVVTKNSAATKEKKAAKKENKKTKPKKTYNKTTKTVIDTLYVQEDVKLRKKPDASSDVIKIVKQGEKVAVTGEEQNDFYPVKVGNKSGYIMVSYLGSNPSKENKTKGSAAKESLGIFKITAYSANSSARTASGTRCKSGRTIAAPSRFAFGTKLMFNGNVYTVEDRGGAIVNNVLDLYVDSESEAVKWGVRYMEVYKVKD